MGISPSGLKTRAFYFPVIKNVGEALESNELARRLVEFDSSHPVLARLRTEEGERLFLVKECWKASRVYGSGQCSYVELDLEEIKEFEGGKP